MKHAPIGVFDSGYGGLTVMKDIVAKLPQFDYLYLGDNARSPYGTRSFDTVYQYTLQCVRWFFQQGCPLVILACNTASAKALRTIQQQDLPLFDSYKRVLGVIRPSSETIGQYTRSKKVGLLATRGTVQSQSYIIEMEKFFPEVQVFQQACPLWVPLIENNEYDNPGADYFIKKNIDQLMMQDENIDTILLACTHYPLLLSKIQSYVSPGISVISQGPIIAESLADYFFRHPEMEGRCSKNGQRRFFTTDSTEDFNNHATIFLGEKIGSSKVHLDLA